MTFFYDLNKKLDSIRAKPEVTHKQLNERDEGKPGKNFEKIAKDAGERYGSKAAGERVAGAVRNKLKKAGKLEEADMDESAFQAAIGKKKYGEKGMKALQKAGREGKSLEPIRKKYDRYDESEVAEPPTDYKEPTSRYDWRQMDKKVETPAYQRKALGAKPLKLGDVTHSKNKDTSEGIEDRIGDLDQSNPVNQPAYQRKAASQGGPRFSGGKAPADMPKSHEGFPRFSGGGGYKGKGVPADESVIYDIGAGLAGAVKSGAKKVMKAISPDKPKPTYKPFPRGYEGSGQEKADWDAFTGRKDYGGLDSDQERQFKEAGAPMTAKQKKFAALADPKDKITFADKIAGAKKEVDEMLGDVAAEAIKGALSPKQKKLDKNNNGKLDANDFAMLRKGAKAPQAKVSQHSTLKPVSNPKSGLSGQVPNNKEETDEGWDDMMRDVKARADKPKVGTITRGHKHDIEHTATGMKVTRRVDDQGMSVGTDDDNADAPKRGRGRPKGTGKSIGAKGPSSKSKLLAKEGGAESSELKAAAALLKKAGYKVTKAADGAEELDEKAVSKKQQRFMGMVHATQKGEKAPSKAVAKVAKSMKKSDAEDFASTKHKGLPEKKKPEAKQDAKTEAPKKKKEKTEEAGGTGTPTASSGFSFGKGIYDSMNRELESMIAESMGQLNESMNVSMNMNSDAQGGPSKSITITATDDDALKLGKLLKNAGLGDGTHPGDEVADQIRAAIDGQDDHGEEVCTACGSADCGCGPEEMDEAYGDNSVTQNAPDYPTNTETSDDALQYAGGLNKPKSTGQTTTPVLASQEERQLTYEADLKRMMEMAGAAIGDYIDYVSPEGDQPGQDILDMPGVEYDPDTGVISVRNATSLANTHRSLEASGWQKQTAAARPNPAAAGQAQMVGDTPYQLGEEDDLARMMEMAGIKESDRKDFFHNPDRPDDEQLPASPEEIHVPGMDEEADDDKDFFHNPDLPDNEQLPASPKEIDVDLQRMREMAGVKKKTDEEKTEEGNKLTGGLADDDIKVGEKIPGTNVIKKKDIDEGILSATANLWKEYKGHYGV